jgi:DNA-binding NarL/FixJ family response regulator
MRVIVVADSVIVREGLSRLLGSEGHEVIDVISRPEQVATAVATGRPDAVILDIRMPPTCTDEGVRVATSLRETWPELGILVLSQYAALWTHSANENWKSYGSWQKDCRTRESPNGSLSHSTP